MTTQFFSALAKSWAVNSAEQALIERAIGSAVFDKLKGGETSSLADSYKAAGGSDDTSKKILTSVDAVFGAASYAHVASALAEATNKVSFSATVASWQVSGAELSLIERTLGHAYFKRLQGVTLNLSDIYDGFGGSDAVTQKTLTTIAPFWDEVKVSAALNRIAAAAA